MRKKENEITEKSDIEAVIHKSLVCRLGLSDGNMPYIVPVCFGYHNDALYVHGSLEGMKIDFLRKNQNVCFELDVDTEIIEAEKACDWGIKYRSVIGFGKASFIEDGDEKRRALDIIMNHYSNRSFEFPQAVLYKTAVIKVEITYMTGKQSGF